MNTNNESPAALLPYTYDYWREGICGSGPHAPNIVAYNGEDVRAIGYVADAHARARIIQAHNEIVQRRAFTAPGASESRGSVPDATPVPCAWCRVDACGRVHYTTNKPRESFGDSVTPLYAQPTPYRVVAPTPPAVSNGEPTAEQWKRAYVEQFIDTPTKDRWDAARELHRRARELASSAAAKGEG